jgi:hypothetical protein
MSPLLIFSHVIPPENLTEFICPHSNHYLCSVCGAYDSHSYLRPYLDTTLYKHIFTYVPTLFHKFSSCIHLIYYILSHYILIMDNVQEQLQRNKIIYLPSCPSSRDLVIGMYVTVSCNRNNHTLHCKHGILQSVSITK